MSETKICENPDCAKEFGRGVLTDGRPERLYHWERRSFCTADCYRRGQWTARYRRLIEEVELLIGSDYPESLTKRVGYSRVKDLLKVLRKQGRPDLADRLAREQARYDAPFAFETEPSPWYA